MEIVRDEEEKQSKAPYAIEEDAVLKKPKGVKFDPNKNYKWTPETLFTLTGDEYGATINALRNILSSPEAQRILAAERAHYMLNEVLVRAVERGDAVESTPPKK